ncbi:protein kinase [Saccharothrix sp. S26]|uniref:serine/threonine protein kinase n=1 Tax=Saccharothrix sp. S26 TaxID=2907215 RepID=UPI001F1C5A4E|nr:protein kinase [Saccharothrix sp. S26]MCE6996017.1 protein kinase [Saccharothrix sp. S26]
MSTAMVNPHSNHLVPLGNGPVATVYAGGGAAYKVLPAALDRRTRAALEREVAKWRRVPFTAAVRGVEELADGVTAVCSELCRHSLAARVRHGGPLPVNEVLDLAQVLAEALGAAHAAGLVHGGVTATNVLFRASGEPVLADGGLMVRRAFPTDPPVDFAAPETVRDAVRDARTDLYGLGAVLYLALTGEVPYPARMGERAEEHLLRVLGSPVPGVTRPDLPPGLADVVRALLSREPDARPTDVAARLAAIAGVGFDDFADTTYHQPAAPFIPMPATPPTALPPAPTGPAPRSVPPVVFPSAPTIPASQPAVFPAPAGPASPQTSFPPAPPIAPPASDAYPIVPPAPPVRMPIVEVTPDRKKSDRTGKAGMVAGIAGALALFAAAPFLLLREDAPPPSPAAPTVNAPGGDTGVQIELEVVEDTGEQVRLAWRSSAKLDYVVIVAPDGQPNWNTGPLREQTTNIKVEPGRKYCFELQGTDGNEVYHSQLKGIRDAVCAK